MPRSFEDESYSSKATEAVVGFERALQKLWEDDIELLSFTVKLPVDEGGEYLLVGRFRKGAGRFVAFKDGDTLAWLLIAFVRALRAKNLKFREDKYANGDD